MNRLEAVIVCVNYSDFLAWTLPTNKNLFDNIVIVTSPADIKTQKLCEFWHIKCLQTNKFFEDGAKINKAKGINVGLDYLKSKNPNLGWVVHQDADIFLTPQFRQFVNKLPADDQTLYSIDRLMCRSFDSWLKFYMKPEIINENNIFLHFRPFPLGVRLAKTDFGGYTPIGFFQMWNQGVKNLRYPEEHKSAARSDIQFTLNFEREKRQLIPEVIGIHLESHKGKMGVNWNGRKSPYFGPKPNIVKRIFKFFKDAFASTQATPTYEEKKDA